MNGCRAFRRARMLTLHIDLFNLKIFAISGLIIFTTIAIIIKAKTFYFSSRPGPGHFAPLFTSPPEGCYWRQGFKEQILIDFALTDFALTDFALIDFALFLRQHFHYLHCCPNGHVKLPGRIWFGVVWLLGWVWFGFGCGLRQGFKEQHTLKSNTFSIGSVVEWRRLFNGCRAFRRARMILLLAVCCLNCCG